MAIWY